MADEDGIFLNSDIQELFWGLNVVVLGDSIQRSVYKDLVCLFDDPNSGYVCDHELRAKGENTFRGDQLIFITEKVNGTNFREVREYVSKNGNTAFRFYFITRCWNDYLESVFKDHFSTHFKPDVIIMNSTLWDMHHYGGEGKFMYEHNMKKLFTEVQMLPSRPLLLWNSALPLADVCKGGFLRKGFKTLPWHDIERANLIAQSMTYSFDFVYVDLRKSLFRSHIFTQAEDGIHWSNKAHRNITNSILTAICRYWNMDVPVPHMPQENRYYDDSLYLPPPQVPPPQVFPLIQPKPLMTPPTTRYHPYARRWLNNEDYIPRAHQRSYTDPFPIQQWRQVDRLHPRHDNYRARYNKMNKLKTASSLRPSRRPLTESNTTPKTAATTSTKTVDNPVKVEDKSNNKDQPKTNQDQDDLENYKDCELCSHGQVCDSESRSNDILAAAASTSANTLTNVENPSNEQSTNSSSATQIANTVDDVSLKVNISDIDESELVKPDLNNNKNENDHDDKFGNNDEGRKRKRDDDSDENDTRPSKTTKLN